MPPQATPSLLTLDNRLENHLHEMDPSWAEVTRDILLHRGKEALYSTPASVRTHQCYEGGLLEHLLETADLSLAMAALGPYQETVDRDLLVAMALIHDIGKVDCYRRTDKGYEYTETDRDIHHIGAGLLILGEARFAHADRWRKLGRYDDSQYLAHAIVSHHGHVAWKAIRAPRSTEAAIVHYADYAGAGLSTLASGAPWRQATS